MKHSCETFANDVLQALGTFQGAGTLENDTRIVPGLYPSWDTANGTVTLTHTSVPENLIRLEGKISGHPQWLTLNLDLGTGSFAAGDVIGIVAEVEGDGEHTLDLFIRTSVKYGDQDTVLPERLPVSAKRRIVTVLHTVGPDDVVVAASSFHTLAIRLPKRDFKLEIRDMRVFVLPASYGLRSSRMTLAVSPH